jgi:hypothetical protein
MAKRTCEIIRARSFSTQPETTWREAVSDKTAALDARMKGTDERLASVQKAMEVNKEAIDKAVGATEKGVKDAVGSIKTDVEKAVGGIKTDMKDALKLEISAMEKVLKSEVAAVKDSFKSEVSSVKDSFKSLERIFILAVAVFIFGKPVLGGIKDVIDAAKEGVSSKKE